MRFISTALPLLVFSGIVFCSPHRKQSKSSSEALSAPSIADAVPTNPGAYTSSAIVDATPTGIEADGPSTTAETKPTETGKHGGGHPSDTPSTVCRVHAGRKGNYVVDIFSEGSDGGDKHHSDGLSDFKKALGLCGLTAFKVKSTKTGFILKGTLHPENKRKVSDVSDKLKCVGVAIKHHDHSDSDVNCKLPKEKPSGENSQNDPAASHTGHAHQSDHVSASASPEPTYHGGAHPL